MVRNTDLQKKWQQTKAIENTNYYHFDNFLQKATYFVWFRISFAVGRQCFVILVFLQLKFLLSGCEPTTQGKTKKKSYKYNNYY